MLPWQRGTGKNVRPPNTTHQRLDRIVLGVIALALGLVTILVGLRIGTIGDMVWIARSSESGESTVTLSYALAFLVFGELVVLFAFAATWRRAKPSKRRRAT
mgnify:CR=1 FL=1